MLLLPCKPFRQLPKRLHWNLVQKPKAEGPCHDAIHIYMQYKYTYTHTYTHLHFPNSSICFCMQNTRIHFTPWRISHCLQPWKALFPKNEWGEHVYGGLEIMGNYYQPESQSPPSANQQPQCRAAMNRAFWGSFVQVYFKNLHDVHDSCLNFLFSLCFKRHLSHGLPRHSDFPFMSTR